MNDIRIAFNANMNFSSSFFSAESNEPLLRQKAFQRWNGSIRLHQENDRWELALIGRNLTDKVIAAYTTDTIGGSPTQFNVNTVRPREVTLQATIRF
jgi:UDP-galactopyranose mutase